MARLNPQIADVLGMQENYESLVKELIKLREIPAVDNGEFVKDIKREIAKRNQEIGELYYYGVREGECYVYENGIVIRKPVQLFSDEYKVRLVRYASYLFNPLESEEKSLRVFGKVLQMDKDDSCSHAVVGRILMDNELYEQALMMFLRGLCLEKADYSAHKRFHLNISDITSRVWKTGHSLEKRLCIPSEVNEEAIINYHSEFSKIDFIDGERHTASNCPYNHA